MAGSPGLQVPQSRSMAAMHPGVLIHTSGRDFDGFICDYVFMFFPPAFLRSRGGAVTRIRKSSQRRTAARTHCVRACGHAIHSHNSKPFRGDMRALVFVELIDRTLYQTANPPTVTTPPAGHP